jgi:hypothetical protein
MPYIPTIPGTDHHHQTANFIEDVVLVWETSNSNKAVT